MSHKAVIKDTGVTDLELLGQAVRELKNEGANIEFLLNSKPRGYTRTQLDVADAVIRYPGGQYDVGFYRNEKGGYRAEADFDMGIDEMVIETGPYTSRSKRHPQDASLNQAQLAMGKLFQRYAVLHAEKVCRQQGYVDLQRIESPNGEIQVVVNLQAA